MIFRKSARPLWRSAGAGIASWSVGLAVLFGCWQFLHQSGHLNPLLLPSVPATLGAAKALLTENRFLAHAAVTLAEILVSFIITVPLGVALGVLIANNEFASTVFKPIVFTLFSIPKSIFLPMFILILGVNFYQKVTFGVLSTIFIVLISTFSALDSVKPDYIRVARAFGATLNQIALRVYLPSMAPILLEAIRLGMIFNVSGILLAEMYASRTGLGQLVANWGENFKLSELLAGILIISVASIAFNECIRCLEARTEHWRA